jgi:hypothetical protein
MLILILAGTAAIAIALIAFLVIVIVGIRICERRMNLTRRPITRAERIARHVLAPEAAARKKEVITK